MAGWVTIVGSVLVIASVFAQIGALESLDTRRGVEDLLAEPPFDQLDVGVATVLSAIRVLAMVTGACAAATAILGWQVMQRSRPARLVLSVLAVPMFLAGLVTGGFTTSLVAAAVVILWLQPARAWVNGDPVPERYLRPPGEKPREDRASTDPSSQEYAGTRPATGPTSAPTTGPTRPAGPSGDTGPAAYPGFGSAPAATQVAPHEAPAWPTAPAPRPPRGEMPNPLRAGLILTWITSGLVVLGLALVVVAIAVDPSELDRQIEQTIADNPTMAGEISVGQVRVALYLALAGLAAWALGAVLLAALAWVGRSWAWVLLCVSAGLAAGLLLLATVVGAWVLAILLALTAGSLALMLRPDVREWYRAG